MVFYLVYASAVRFVCSFVYQALIDLPSVSLSFRTMMIYPLTVIIHTPDRLAFSLAIFAYDHSTRFDVHSASCIPLERRVKHTNMGDIKTQRKMEMKAKYKLSGS